MASVATADCGAFGEAVVFLCYFKDLPDPRQRGKIVYPLDEVLLLCLLAVLAGSETFVDIAWVAAVTGVPSGVVAIDGKTSRRSYQKKAGKAPIHMVSAFAARGGASARRLARSAASSAIANSAAHPTPGACRPRCAHPFCRHDRCHRGRCRRNPCRFRAARRAVELLAEGEAARHWKPDI